MISPTHPLNGLNLPGLSPNMEPHIQEAILEQIRLHNLRARLSLFISTALQREGAAVFLAENGWEVHYQGAIFEVSILLSQEEEEQP